MTWLGCDDALPARPGRIAVAGTSGSGKSSVAVLLARLLRVPYVEMDALFHGPRWTEVPTFAEDVAAFVAGPGWVTEYQYAPVRPLVTDRLDLLVWLDLPRRVVLRQVIRRTLVRRLRRQVLWNGNIEPPLWTLATDRDHIIRWAWRTHAHNAPRIDQALQRRPDLVVVRLRSHAELRHWLAGPVMAVAYPAGVQHAR